MSLFTGAAIIGAALAAGTAGVVSAKIGSDSAKEAGDAASKSNAAALAFQKQQAENEYRNQETTRRANYDQHVAQQEANNKIRQAMGLAPVTVPAYVPSVDPGFTAGAPPPAGGPSIGTMASAPPLVSAPPTVARAATPQSIQPQFLPMDRSMTLGTMAGAPMPTGPSPWVGPTPQQLDELRKRVQS